MKNRVKRPFFSYLGSKFFLAAHGTYVPPASDIIIEPFAGSAGYSLAFPQKRVLLIDKYEKVVEVWRYLISVSEEEILGLPDIDERGIEGLPAHVCQEARWLIGWWLDTNLPRPRSVPGGYAKSGVKPEKFWGPKVRRSISSNLKFIRHWEVRQGDYTSAPDIEATWFVDPPYQSMTGGLTYPFHSKKIDYEQLGRWCRSRRGQVTVCEGDGADWLPFVRIGTTHGAPKSRKRAASTPKHSGEYVWPPTSVRQLDLFHMAHSHAHAHAHAHAAAEAGR